MSKVFGMCFGFALLHYVSHWLAKLTPFYQPMRTEKNKNNVTRSHAFSRAWRRLRVIGLNSDWCIAVFALGCDWPE